MSAGIAIKTSGTDDKERAIKKKKAQLKSIDTGKRQKVNTTALDKNLPPQRVFTHKEAIYPTN